MRNRILLALVMVAAGCSDNVRSSAPESDIPLATSEQSLALQRLQRSTGGSWDLAIHPSLGTPTLLAGRSAPMLEGRTAAAATTHFLAEYRELFHMKDPSRELFVTREEKDDLGMTHARFEQRIGGLRVIGGELLAHYGAGGELASIRARYVPGLDALDLNPQIDGARALDVAAVDLQKARTELDTARLVSTSEAELVVFVDDDAHASLAYRVHLRSPEAVRMEYTIDARTGAILQSFDDIETIAGSGAGVIGDTKALQITQTGATYQLRDTTRTPAGITTYTAANGTTTPGTIVSSATSTAFDNAAVGKGAAVDAHFFAGAVYDYYKTVHGRSGIDGNNGAIVSTVHFQSRYNNAFWDGTQMAYGDGDGTNFRAFSASLDVIAHELTHGVTQFTSQLQYVNQSGALNEAVSDIFGVFVEHMYKDDAKNNWILGEGISLTATPIRDMIHPSLRQQPSNMTQLVKTTQDNGGVHINSGIINNAMFLMTMGGTNDASKTVVSQGLGWENSQKLWYRAQTKYFGATTDFAGAAQDTLLAATDLAFTQNQKNIVECAWIATGVMPGACKTLVAEGNGGAPAADAGAGNTGSGNTTPNPPSPTGTGKSDAGAGSSNDGTSGSNGDTTGDDSSGSGSDGTTTTPRKPRALTAQPASQGGCSVSAPGNTETPALFGLAFAAMLGALGIRRRRA
jgi:MYXO-CTERM domain-containing protein